MTKKNNRIYTFKTVLLVPKSTNTFASIRGNNLMAFTMQSTILSISICIFGKLGLNIKVSSFSNNSVNLMPGFVF